MTIPDYWAEPEQEPELQDFDLDGLDDDELEGFIDELIEDEEAAQLEEAETEIARRVQVDIGHISKEIGRELTNAETEGIADHAMESMRRGERINVRDGWEKHWLNQGREPWDMDRSVDRSLFMQERMKDSARDAVEYPEPEPERDYEPLQAGASDQEVSAWYNARLAPQESAPQEAAPQAE